MFYFIVIGIVVRVQIYYFVNENIYILILGGYVLFIKDSENLYY